MADENEQNGELGPNGDTEPGASEAEKLRAELEDARKKARESYDTMLRTAADFDNYRKRMARDSVREREQAEEKVLKKLLPVLDNFARGLEHMKTATSLEKIKEGTEATMRQLESVLQECGVTKMDVLHKPFDPKVHEAITQAPSAEHPEGTIVAVAEDGYQIKDRVLRYAKVVVSKAP